MATMDNESLQIGAQMNSVWIWFAVAAILLAGEMITTSFVLIFFALGAAATAALVFLNPQMPGAAQVIVFGAVGLIGLAAGRRWIKARLQSNAAPAVQLDSNAEFVVDRDIASGAEGAVLYQGSPWTAVNDGSEIIRAGDRVRIVRTSGIKIMIVKV